MAFELNDLPYSHDALEAAGMSKETLEFHHDLHHKAYVDNGNRGRAVFMGGGDPSGDFSIIDYFNMTSEGNAVYFGDLTQSRERPAASSTSIRGIWCGGGNTPTNTNIIDYITITSTGTAKDFGDNQQASNQNAAVNSTTRMVHRGANNNIIS